MHQRSKIICPLAREVIKRKIDKEFAKKRQNARAPIHRAKVRGLRESGVRVVKLFGAIRCAPAVPCRQLFVQ